MQTKKPVCTWKEKYDTAYNQTTNTCLILQKPIVSKQAAQAVVKHHYNGTTVRYGKSALALSKEYSMYCVSKTPLI